MVPTISASPATPPPSTLTSSSTTPSLSRWSSLSSRAIRSADNDDPLRDLLSRFASGLEQFYDSLLQLHLHASNVLHSKTRSSIFSLAIRCLVFQTIVNLIASRLRQNICTAYNQLFFPTVLLFRYLYPKPWDALFMDTVRALKCEMRADLVARPEPRYFVELRSYIRRTFKVYAITAVVHWLLNRDGAFKWPSQGLALLAGQQYLQHQGAKHSMAKIFFVAAFIGPNWTIWLIQIWIQQQLFLYELLQPYLVRVQFKEWEERAWWKEHEMELQGFAFGVWALCSIPYIGVATLPLMFPAVAFLLSRSCGLMENSGHGLSGDIIEKRNPGIKAVALGKSKAVQGDWDSVSVKTYVKSSQSQQQQQQEAYSSKPLQHARMLDKNGHQSASFYALDQGSSGVVSEDQIWDDKQLVQARRKELYRQQQRHMAQRQHQHEIYQQMANQHQQAANVNMSPTPVSLPALIPRLPQVTATTTSSSASGAASSEGQPEEVIRERDLTEYNFSDRKNDGSAPSAPPAPIFTPPLVSRDMPTWSKHMNIHPSDHNPYHTESTMGDYARMGPPLTGSSVLQSPESNWQSDIIRSQNAIAHGNANRRQGEFNRQHSEAIRRRGKDSRQRDETDRDRAAPNQPIAQNVRVSIGEDRRQLNVNMKAVKKNINQAIRPLVPSTTVPELLGNRARDDSGKQEDENDSFGENGLVSDKSLDNIVEDSHFEDEDSEYLYDSLSGDERSKPRDHWERDQYDDGDDDDEDDGNPYYDHHLARPTERIPLQYFKGRRDRRRHSHAQSETSSSAAEEPTSRRRMDRRALSDENTKIHKALPYLPATHRAPLTQTQGFSSLEYIPPVPPKDIPSMTRREQSKSQPQLGLQSQLKHPQQLSPRRPLPRHRRQQYELHPLERQIVQAPSQRGGLAAKIAQSMQKLEENVEKDLSSALRKYNWTKTAHVVALPSSKSSSNLSASALASTPSSRSTTDLSLESRKKDIEERGHEGIGEIEGKEGGGGEGAIAGDDSAEKEKKYIPPKTALYDDKDGIDTRIVHKPESNK
ncbi:hypothetical protein BX616_002501 [Lobosporangium transversale]|uniref:Uncharacterized protein n=1 Tax=Lobosporangium transversale TaxID=64571 RepID=A0A1Y2GYL9_9FUNG|nr:hypothetical protein BCR41DRAFT_367905 [Lobosporangium transversale]KAF9900782.1 hypothetical protein BX616_002501 [Lobosporangium transversale]ORZ26904.1 hypothetical protein BCR41DRAFT_367905 [Lobosporangium transversale]|eukprot:XP_021884651.1 hypothetical protein BCR41DRAFT_367905 [Lobosporangium transversale]